MKENEVIKLAEALYDKYGCGDHWEIVKLEKVENGYSLIIKKVQEPAEKEGAENESN